MSDGLIEQQKKDLEWAMLQDRLKEPEQDNARLKEELEQERVRLAGCAYAAHGNGPIAEQGDYGWSPAYQDVWELRTRLTKLEAALEISEKAHAGVLAEYGVLEAAVGEWAKTFRAWREDNDSEEANGALWEAEDKLLAMQGGEDAPDIPD